MEEVSIFHLELSLLLKPGTSSLRCWWCTAHDVWFGLTVATLTAIARPHIVITGSRPPGFQDAHRRGHTGCDLYRVNVDAM